ncbi:MAG: hypothetical protein CM1200mP3_02530 [Chloroflexota bacterium]|nr:MAG: hypothetical protein CM1200mP3_02530 [Chloroflexota bacterium]
MEASNNCWYIVARFGTAGLCFSHSIVSWDFAVLIGLRDGIPLYLPRIYYWGIHSGVSAVAMLMALAVWIYGLQNYINRIILMQSEDCL